MPGVGGLVAAGCPQTLTVLVCAGVQVPVRFVYEARAPEVARDGEGSVCNSGPFPAILHLFTSTNESGLAGEATQQLFHLESRRCSPKCHYAGGGG